MATVLQYNLRTLQFTHLLCAMKWFYYIQNCTIIATINFRTFASPKRAPLLISSRSPFSPSSARSRQPPVYSRLPGLPVLDISWTWPDATCSLLGLVPFTQHSVCEAHSCVACLSTSFLSFYGRVALHVCAHHVLFIHPSTDGRESCLYLSAITNTLR